MGHLHLCLFGRFSIECSGSPLALEGQKVQELLCYLLIHPDRCHFREKLATVLWENSSGAQSKQYLRRSLWQLQAALENGQPAATPLLLVESDWIQIDATADFWCDVGQFENAFTRTKATPGAQLAADEAQLLSDAAALYRGDLLENWYQEWCIIERERLQNMYLMMLDKLMSYCEMRHEYERGIVYGSQILRCDVARERTYRRLMRLYYLRGDRTGALRQYERCTQVLAEELDVRPGRKTLALYQQIKEDRPLTSPPPPVTAAASPALLVELLQHLDRLQTSLAEAQEQVRRDVESVKAALHSKR